MGFKTAPQEVREAFARLRQTLNKPISLHKISGGYYVYEYSSARDPKKMKAVIRTQYLGKLSEDGSFTPKKTGRQATEEPVVQPKPVHISGNVDEREAIALRNLSMNGRMSMAKLAKRLGMSTTGARHFVKRMEEKYKIRYFAELNTLKLGYLRYIALIKFEDKIPAIDKIKESFEEDPHVVFVAMINGIYDMMIIFYLENNTSLTKFIYEWRSSNALPEYTAKWYITALSMAVGIAIPLRKQFARYIDTKAELRNGGNKEASSLTLIESHVLKEIITNGVLEFEKIDQKYGLSSGRSNYAFYKLREKEVISRVTVTILPPNLRYNSIFITHTNNYKKFIESRDEWLKETLMFDTPLINKDAFRGDMGIPDSIFYIRPIFEEIDFQNAKQKLALIEGTETESMIITNVVVGSLCYRNFDPTYTQTYETLLKRNKIKPQNKIDY